LRAAQRSRLQLTLGRVVFVPHVPERHARERNFTNRSTEAENSVRVSYTRALPAGTEIELGASLKFADRLHYDSHSRSLTTARRLGAETPEIVKRHVPAVTQGRLDAAGAQPFPDPGEYERPT
jgi:hypothetical protein